jgi:hypothetical protein
MADSFPETPQGKIDWLAMEEMERRGILPDVFKGALYEAQKRGMVGPTKGTLRAQLGDLPMGERFMQGLTDIGEGALQLGAHMFPGSLPAVPGPQSPLSMIDRRISEDQAAYTARREEAGGGGGLPDFARVGGNATGMLPTALVAAPETVVGGMVTGALGGAAGNMLAPVTDPQADYWREKTKQAALGGVAGAITGGGMNAIAGSIAPEPTAGVGNLMKRGVTPTPGQILGGAANRVEEKMASIPLLGDMISGGRRRAMEDFNRAAINDTLSSIGKTGSGKIGREGIQEAENLLQAEYNKLLPKLTFAADQQMVDDIVNIRQMASFLPEKEFIQFEKVLQQKIGPKLGQNGAMDGESFKVLESELTRLAKQYKKDTSADANQLGDAIDEVLTSMRANLERSNPMHAGELSKVNLGWAKFKRIQRASTMQNRDDPGVFSGPQLQQAVKALDRSKDHGAFARGSALMQDLSEDATKVLGDKVPNSGTPERLLAAMGLGGYMEPTSLIASGALSLPYTKVGQKAFAQALTKRPPGSNLIAELLRRASVPAAAGAASATLPNR